MIAALIAQLPPAPGQEPWPWLAGLMVGACAFLGRELLKRADEDIDEWRQAAKDATASLALSTAALTTITDTLASMSTTSSRELADAAKAQSAQIAGVRRDILSAVARNYRTIQDKDSS